MNIKTVIHVIIAFLVFGVLVLLVGVALKHMDNKVRVTQEINACDSTGGMYILTTKVIRGWVHGGSEEYVSTSNCITLTELHRIKPRQKVKADNFAAIFREAIKNENK